MGWLTYIAAAGLRLVASASDPGNPPHHLELYEDPGGRLGDARVLVMINGSPHARYSPFLVGDEATFEIHRLINASPASAAAR